MIPKIIYKTGPFEKSNLPDEIEAIFNKTIKDKFNWPREITVKLGDYIFRPGEKAEHKGKVGQKKKNNN